MKILRYNEGLNKWNIIGDKINGENTNDEFGYSLSLSSDGSFVAISARYNDSNGQNSGQVQVYEYNDNNDSWIRLGQKINGRGSR